MSAEIARAPLHQYDDAANVFADISDLRQQIKDHKAIILRGLVTEQKANDIVQSLVDQFSESEDKRRNPEVTRQRENYQRLDLGEYGGVSRFMRTFFQFSWNNDTLGIQPIFSLLTTLRNRLMGLSDTFPENAADTAVGYNASRIIQYPRGGGFMGGHKDSLAPEIAKTTGASFKANYVALLSLSRRNEQFETGGAWIEGPSGELIDLDGTTCPGDILLYDQQTTHGVAGIDIDQPIDLGSVSGRLVALSTPYPFQS